MCQWLIQIFLITVYLALLVVCDPIQKSAVKKPMFNRPPNLIKIPEVRHEGYVFGNSNAPDNAGDNNDSGGRKLRDQVCDSQANTGCSRRCMQLRANCLCGSNAKTYRNQCEMSCMRKVEQQKINWLHYGKCEPACSSERTERFREMVRDMMTVEYLKTKVRRCSRITNCAQAKLVIQYTMGNQSISECPKNLPAYLLFSHLDCSDLLQLRLNKIYNNEPVISCNSAEMVYKKLFNDKNCARKRKGPNEKKLIQWSFDLLDANRDFNLRENELNILTLIPDQECGENFFQNCDTDRDGLIRENEWSACMGCPDCYRPCFVFQAERELVDRRRRFINSIVNCKRDGNCEPKQCERYLRHVQCWCVDLSCNEIPGTKSYAKQQC